MKKEKRIIYIMGGGRSGTTITDIILGNSSGIESLGEIFRFPELRGEPHGFTKNSSCYRFWDKIKTNFLSSTNYSFDEIEKNTYSFEYHSNFLKTILNLNSHKNKIIYKKYNNLLFKIIFNNVTPNTLIDSSKYPGRAIALSRYLDYQISFIYLKRDPKSVVKSFQKENIEQPSKSVFEAKLYYFLVNLFCKISCRYLHKKGFKVIELKFEDLIREPIITLTSIERMLNINLEEVKRKISEDCYLKVENLFEGNRIRMKNEIKINKNKIEENNYKEININYKLYNNKTI